MPWTMKVTSKGTQLFASRLQFLGAQAALPTASGQRPTRSGQLAIATNVHHSMGYVRPVNILGIRWYSVTIWRCLFFSLDMSKLLMQSR
jgi:hypothetical protein